MTYMTLADFVLDQLTDEDAREQVRILAGATASNDPGVRAAADEQLRAMAFQYRDRVGYRREWRP